MKLTQQSISETPAGQTQGEENPEVQTFQIPATSTLVTPTLQLMPFIQKKGEEVPDFNTVYYDRATKRIMRRTEKKVEAKDLSGRMVTDTTVMLGTDKDPRLTIRAGAALIDASEDNINKVMIELESAKKTSAQLKDTLRKERDDGNRLKRKYEHMQRELESSKGEVHALQVEMQAKGTAQESLENVQQEAQSLKKEKE